jgi:spore maturation protein CgeB
MQTNHSDSIFKGRLLILDGIGGVPLGREMQQAFEALGIEASHYDCADLDRISFYGLRAGVSKLLNKWEGMDEFVHMPKVHPDVISDILKKEQPKAILVIGFIYKFIEPRWLKKLADQFECGLYLYDTDSCNLYSKRREFIFFLEKELAVYDSVFSFSRVTTNFFRRTKGLNAHYLPFGASMIDMPANVEEHRDVLFVGSGDLRRILLLESIAGHVSVFGDRWERNYPLISETLRAGVVDHPVWGADLHRLMAESKIILNITRGPFYAAETGINLRIFEALAAGKFLLTDYCDEVAELFDVGKEIETFKSSCELREKVDFYLAHPERRLEIARHGHQKYLENFTWKARAQYLASLIGLGCG